MEKTFFEDFMKFQKECPTIPLDSEASFPTKKGGQFKFKYASLGSILKIVRPILHDCNLIQYWKCKESGAVTCVLEHLDIAGISLQKKTHVKHSTVMIKSSDDPKQQGAAITYAKRYSLVALLGIVAEEDKDAPTPNIGQPKAKMTSKLFEDAKSRIANGDQDILKKCLLTLDITEEQKGALTNLEYQYNL